MKLSCFFLSCTVLHNIVSNASQFNKPNGSQKFLPVGGFRNRQPARNVIDCSWKCTKDSQCVSFFFVEDTSLCQTHAKVIDDVDVNEAMPTAIFYTMVDDIDECGDNTDICHADATCTHTEGSFTCVCNSGYIGDGVATCIDDDECADNINYCHAEATCTNTVGSFTCACYSGYTGDGLKTCTDTECTDNTDNCQADATCTNTVGSFTCACNSGYTGDGVATYEDECTDNTDNCHADATCTNTEGSFTCVCNSGYNGDGTTTCIACPTDNTVYTTMQLADGSPFTYKIFDQTTASQAVAMSNCAADGANLVRMTSIAKMDVLAQLISCTGYTGSFYRVDLTNIDATDLLDVNQWVSSVGIPLPTGNHFWYASQPTIPSTKNCARLVKSYYGKLGNIGCVSLQNYICEK